MSKIFIFLFLSIIANLQIASAQAPTQEQCQQADAQLNQVYQQLRGTLNNSQQQQLKQAQRDWIKKRDAFVAANSGNPQGALYQATMQRVRELSGFHGKTPQQAQLENSVQVISGKPSNQQNVTQEQCQQADAQLNQVYQQLMGTLNEEKKKQLKMGQLDWIKKRDVFVAANSGNPLESMYQATQERIMRLDSLSGSKNENFYITEEEIPNLENKLLNTIEELKQCLDDTQKQCFDDIQKKWMKNQEASIASNRKWNESHLNRLEAMINPKSGYYYALINRIKEVDAKVKNINLSTRKITHIDNVQNITIPIYQEVNWSNLNIVAEVSGAKYRAVSIVGDNKIYVFDVRSKLLYGVIEASNGALTEMDPPRFLCFAGNERFLFSEKNSLKGKAYQFNEIPSLLFVYGNSTYRRDIDGPYLDENKNLGVCVFGTGENLPSTCYFRSAAQSELENESDLVSKKSNANTEYFSAHPEMASRIGEFKGIEEERDVTPIQKLYVDKEGVFKSSLQKSDSQVFKEAKTQKTLAGSVKMFL